MKYNEVIVIGGGLSGLIAAAAAAKTGKQVLVLTYGAGTLTIGGGIIDILGYSDNGKPLPSPAAGLKLIHDGHPYKKIGVTAITDAINFFKEISKTEGYPYIGGLNEMQWVPTAAGTLKPTCLVPRTMDGTVLHKANTVIVIGFDGLKDFYPDLVAKNLQKVYGSNKTIISKSIPLNFERGRDITTLDIARWLDTKEGRAAFIDRLKNVAVPGSTIVLPPVLGTKPDYNIPNYIEQILNCSLIEAASLPPAVGGLRMRAMLINHLRKFGVTVIEKAAVTGAIIKDKECSAVITNNCDRERHYYGKTFILASGGLYGGGLRANPDGIIEPVFNLPIAVPHQIDEWSNVSLFANKKQPFALLGVNVNEAMNPLAADGSVILNNVKIVGRNLSGYDFCFEKSGNGVALASGYKAAMSL